MRKIWLMLLMLAIGIAIGLTISNRLASVAAQSKPGAGFAAVPGSLGSEDLTGPYDVVKNWPQDVSTLPGNEKWTYGAGESVFAESPNRIYMLFRGELPKMAPPKAALLPQLGPSITFPVSGFWRDATVASLPGTGGTGDDVSEWLTSWEGKAPDHGIKGPPYRQLGVDAKWENCVVVVDGSGKIIETWKQWDKLFRRPHSIYISPYDPEKNVWIVDDNMQVIYKFTHDGKQTSANHRDAGSGWRGRYALQPADLYRLAAGRHLLRLRWLHRNTRGEVRKEGKFLMQWGKLGRAAGAEPKWTPGQATLAMCTGWRWIRPTRHVFVNDRNNHRIQVFDENGKYLYEWKIDADPSSLHLLYIGSGKTIWTYDRTTNKMVEWDLQGHLLYSWGSMGVFPGGLWGVHGMSVDQEGNLYVAEVDAGRVQKFRPKAGANPEFVVAKPVYSAWR